MLMTSPVHLAAQPAQSARPSAPISAWVAQQIVETNRRLLNPLLTPGRRARLQRRVVDLQKLLEVTRGN